MILRIYSDKKTDYENILNTIGAKPWNYFVRSFEKKNQIWMFIPKRPNHFSVFHFDEEKYIGVTLEIE